MKYLVLIWVLALSISVIAADNGTSPQSVGAAVLSIPPVPAAAAVSAPTSSSPMPVVVKDDSVAPPAWMQDLFVTIKSLPVIGPIVVKVLNWLCVVASIMTALVAFLLAMCKALDFTGIAAIMGFEQKLEDFENSKFLYYAKYLAAYTKPFVKPETPPELKKTAAA